MQDSLINDKEFDDILKVVRNNDVFAIIAPTGCGKSSKMVKYFFTYNYSIFVVNPTNISVQDVYLRNKDQIGDEFVGHAYDSKVSYNNKIVSKMRNEVYSETVKDTAIIIATAGHTKLVFFDLIRYFNRTGDKNLKFCDILMLDESHNGTMDLELIMRLWKYAHSRGAILPKLLLTSATLDVKLTVFPEAEVYKIVRKSSPIDIIYTLKDYEPDSEFIYSDLSKMVLYLHQKIVNEGIDGELWLIFCPGVGEIDKVYKMLVNKFNNLFVIKLYSTQANKNDDFKNMPGKNNRKIIISTNMCETSVTIPNLSRVFDTLIEKITVESENGGSMLLTTNISKSSATQRSGRVGRTSKGTSYRMCTENFFNKLQEQKTAEIFRMPLSETIIELLNIGVDPIEILHGLDEKRFNKTYNTLSHLKMIITIGDYVYITELGKFSAFFKMDLYSCAIFYNWLNGKNTIFPGIVLSSIINCYTSSNDKNSFFNYPKKEEKQNNKDYENTIIDYYNSNFKKFNSGSIIGTIYQMVNNILEYTYNDIKDEEVIKKYCIQNNLNGNKFIELFNKINEIGNVLKKKGMNYDIREYDTVKIIKIVNPILKSVYSDKILNLKSKTPKILYVSSKGDEYLLDVRNPIDNEIHEKIIMMASFEMQSNSTKKPQKTITMYHPI
jgi:HrpA-like RNA helicase